MNILHKKNIFLFMLLFTLCFFLEANVGENLPRNKILLMSYDGISYVDSNVKSKYISSLCTLLRNKNVYSCPIDINSMQENKFKIFWSKFSKKINNFCENTSNKSLCKEIENVRLSVLYSGRARR